MTWPSEQTFKRQPFITIIMLGVQQTRGYMRTALRVMHHMIPQRRTTLRGNPFVTTMAVRCFGVSGGATRNIGEVNWEVVAHLSEWHAHDMMLPLAKRMLLVPTDNMIKGWEEQFDEGTHELVNQVRRCAEQKNVDNNVTNMDQVLMKATDGMRRVLENDAMDPHMFPSDIMFHGATSPARELLTGMLYKVQAKAREQQHGGACNDHAGFAISSHMGQGKSTLMRLLTCLSAFLWPNCWSLFMDVRQLDNDLDVRAVDILAFLCQVRRHEGICSPLHTMEATKVAPILCLDEVDGMYKSREHLWNDVAMLASKPGVALFAASSEARLPLIVNGVDTRLIRELYGVEPRSSWNSTKLTLRSLPPVTTVQQYFTLFEGRIPQAWRAMSDSRKRLFVKQVAQLTGGNLRIIGSIWDNINSGLSMGATLQELAAARAIPQSWDSIDVGQRLILQSLASRDPLDSDATPTMTKHEALAILGKHRDELSMGPGVSLDGLLDSYVNSGWLLEISRGGSGQGIAARYPALLFITPTVFLGHVHADFDTSVKPVADDLRGLGLRVQYCERGAENDDFGDCSLVEQERAWVRAARVVTLIVSDTFAKRVLSTKDQGYSTEHYGCIRELDLCMQRLAEGCDDDKEEAFSVVLVHALEAMAPTPQFDKLKAALKIRGRYHGLGSAWDAQVDATWTSIDDVALLALRHMAS